jgi:hypothetical protein
MSTHLDHRIQRLEQIHREVNWRADQEFKRAIAAGVGNPVRGDRRKDELIEEGERMLLELLAELRPSAVTS